MRGKADGLKRIIPPAQVAMYLVLYSLNIDPAAFMPILVPNMSYADEAVGILFGIVGGFVAWRLTRPRLEAHLNQGEDIRWSGLVWSWSLMLPQILTLALVHQPPHFGLHAGYMLAALPVQMICYYRWGGRLGDQPAE
jgi:hypothetical protein